MDMEVRVRTDHSVAAMRVAITPALNLELWLYTVAGNFDPLMTRHLAPESILEPFVSEEFPKKIGDDKGMIVSVWILVIQIVDDIDQ